MALEVVRGSRLAVSDKAEPKGHLDEGGGGTRFGMMEENGGVIGMLQGFKQSTETVYGRPFLEDLKILFSSFQHWIRSVVWGLEGPADSVVMDEDHR